MSFLCQIFSRIYFILTRAVYFTSDYFNILSKTESRNGRVVICLLIQICTKLDSLCMKKLRILPVWAFVNVLSLLSRMRMCTGGKNISLYKKCQKKFIRNLFQREMNMNIFSSFSHCVKNMFVDSIKSFSSTWILSQIFIVNSISINFVDRF